MTDELAPPRKSVELEDPGTHTLDSSDESSDQFTDASEGHRRAASQASQRSAAASPIPITRVERVDDEPAHGEVPGTKAYDLRTQDAVPDEVAVVSRSRSASRASPSDRPTTPNTVQIPKIIAEKIDPDTPSHGDVPGTDAYDKRRADAIPDLVVRSPQVDAAPDPWQQDTTAGSVEDSDDAAAAAAAEGGNGGGDDDDFGDDFDDFEEGQEGDDDFGEFDEGTDQPDEGDQENSSLPAVASPLPPIPSLDWNNIDDIDDLESALEPYLAKLYPQADLASHTEPSQPPSQSFLSDRSLSLYQQLVAPPPLAPPNWLRSRIRRLFLVSLGVPVDLDEILPASKQKKLILPSGNFGDRSPRPSSDSRGGPAGVGQVGRLKDENNNSSASLDSSGVKRTGSARRKPREEAPPKYDLGSARRMAGTTQARMEGMSDAELREHVKGLEELNERGRETLGFWERRREGAEKEKEAFEGVIENLVKHARKVRK